MIEELYYIYPTRRNETAVILWKDGDEWSHLFGKSLPFEQSPAETAARVMSEKTCGLLYCVDVRHLTDTIKGQQLCVDNTYVIGIKSGILFGSDYHKNMQKIQDSGNVRSSSWLKTSDIARFYVSDLVKAEGFNCVDSGGNLQQISKATKLLLSKALSQNMVALAAYHPKNFMRVTHDTTDHLSGLTSLVIRA